MNTRTASIIASASCCQCGRRTEDFALCPGCEADGHEPCGARPAEYRCSDHRPVNLPDDPGAKVERSVYPSSGREFFLAVCRDRCGLILNSGHHFRGKVAAQGWCDRHNTEHH